LPANKGGQHPGMVVNITGIYIKAPLEGYYVLKDLSRTFSLNILQEHEVPITMWKASPNALDVELVWSDESNSDRLLKQQLQF